MSRVERPNGFGPPQQPPVGGPQVPPRPQGYAPTQMAQGPVPPVPQPPPHGRGVQANFGYARPPLTPEAAAPLARVFAGRNVDINHFSDLPNLLRSVDVRVLQRAVTLDELAKRLAAAGLALAYPLNAPQNMRAGMLKPLLKGSSVSVKEAIAALDTLQQQRCVAYGGDPATDTRQSIGRLLYATMGREPADPGQRQALCERLVYCIESASNGAELISLARTVRQAREPRRPTPPQPAPLPHPMSAAANPYAGGPPRPYVAPPPVQDHVPQAPVVQDAVPGARMAQPPVSQTRPPDLASIVVPNIDRQVFEDVVILMHVANAGAAHNRSLLSLVQESGGSPQVVGWLTTATGIAPERLTAAFGRFQKTVPPEAMNPPEGSTDVADNRTLMKAYLESEGVNSVDLRENGAGHQPLSDQFLDFVAGARNLGILLNLSVQVHRQAKRE